jgi:hypothetical protein
MYGIIGQIGRGRKSRAWYSRRLQKAAALKKKGISGYTDVGGESGDERGEGGSCIHPDSLASHSQSVDARLVYLAGLSKDAIYQRYVKVLDDKVDVSASPMSRDCNELTIVQEENGAELENIPTWITWNYGQKYLLHSTNAKQTMHLLAKENWEMGEEAQFLVLYMGLALQEVMAMQFEEENGEAFCGMGAEVTVEAG